MDVLSSRVLLRPSDLDRSRDVRVPYSVIYDLRGDQISALRIYFDAPDDEQPQFGAWLELRASDPGVLDAGLAEVKHPGHPYCLMIPGGQVSTIARTSRPQRVRGG